jgi:demethylmenaquinone methyltransferase/2-methoxy-6-polyprenyl-1,4-benzoquinol methylase
MSQTSFVRQPLDTVIARYNRVAPWYRYLEWTVLLAPGFRRRAAQRLALSPGQCVLEVGCGTGRNLAVLRAGVGPEGEVIGVDATPGMLAEAGKLIERRGWANVALVQADAATLTLDRQVDAVYFSLSYSAMPDRDAALERAWRALRPGGTLAIMDAGLSDNVLGRILAPAAELIATAFPGDPYSRPWDDLRRLTPAVTTERFQLGLYFVCVARKPALAAG